MKRVFVSYSRNNIGVVTQLILDLRAVGVDVWHDQSLTGGQRWWEGILDEIRQREVLIFALSPESWDSEACKSELTYANQLGKTVLPVLVSNGLNLNFLPAPFSEYQVTDYRSPDRDAAFALVKAVNTANDAAPLPDQLPSPPKVPVSYLNNLKERIDSKEPLDAQEQITLLFEIENAVREGRSRAARVGIRDLLMGLKRRDELLAKVAAKIDVAMKNLEEDETSSSQENASFESSTPSPPTPQEASSIHQIDPVNQQCHQCFVATVSGSKFCAHCGATLRVPHSVAGDLPALSLGRSGNLTPRSKIRRFACEPTNVPHLVADLKFWLDAQKFDSQQMSTEGNDVVLQIKKQGGWRDFVGMSTALNVLFHQSGSTLTVEIGAGKWLDKAAAGAVSMVILWPLAVTAGIGAWQQMKMPDKIFDYLSTRVLH